jgi:hypothetical protein
MGPAGNRAPLSKLMQRSGSPIGQDEVRQRLSAALQNGAPADKVRAVETLTKFATLLTGEGAGDMAKQLGGQAVEAVRRTTTDADPTVRGWATYLYCILSGDRELPRQMLKDPAWVVRALGVITTDGMGQPHDLFKPLAESDPDPVVKKLASAALEAKITRPAREPASTQPAAPVPAAATTPPAAPGAAAAPATGAVAPAEGAAPPAPAAPAEGAATPPAPAAAPTEPGTPSAPVVPPPPAVPVVPPPPAEAAPISPPAR